MTTTSKAKQAVFSAVLALLKTNRFDDITVSEIIEKASISRTTFYRLFEDKYDLLDKFAFGMLEKFVGYGDFSKNKWRLFCTDFLNQSINSSSLKKFFINSGGQFFMTYKRFFFKLLSHRSQRCGLDHDAIKEDELSVLSAILVTEYYDWFSKDCDKTADELIEHTISFIPSRYIELLELNDD